MQEYKSVTFVFLMCSYFPAFILCIFTKEFFFKHASCSISAFCQIEPCPSALDGFDEIIRQASMKEIIIFLDYDGTLSPIVTDPDKAYISDEVSKCVNVSNTPLNGLHPTLLLVYNPPDA